MQRKFVQRLRPLGLVATAAIVALTGVATLSSQSVAAGTYTPVDAGDVVVVDAIDNSSELTGGGSAVPFTLRLPDGATCPGDSAHDQWRVQSFLIPSTVDMASVKWG